MKCKLIQIIVVAIFTYIAAISYSCSDKADQTRRLLKQAESVMQNYPDSALKVLDEILYPEILNESLYYKYILLMVQAKDKNYKDISGDTIIGRAAEYFTKAGDSHDAALARFYQGRIKMYQENYKDAIEDLLFAEELAKKEQHDNLLGLINDDIGTIYRKQINYDKCIEHYNLSRAYFSKAGNKKNENVMVNRIGNVYLCMEPPQVEKAFSLYDQAYEYAVQEKDTMQMFACLNNLSVAYLDIKDYGNAKKYIQESILLDKKKEFVLRNYAILTSIFLETNELDSAVIFLNSISEIIEKNRNNHDLYYYNKLLYSVYENKGDYKTALDYYKKSQEYLSLIYEENNEKSILEIQEKYNRTKVENLYNQTVIKNQRLHLWFVISSLFVLIATVVSIAIYKNNKKKKLEAEDTIETLNNLLSDSNKSNELLRKRVVEELELTKKIAYIHATDSNKAKKVITEYDKLFDRNLRNALDWENLYQLLDESYPGFRVKLDRHYPNLSEKEKQMCYLTKAGFRTNEIAYLLGYSRESADTMKCKLRRKSGFSSMAEFTDFLNKL